MPEFVETANGRIAYSVRGEGKPLVMLPGFLGSAASWLMYGYPEELSNYRCICIDPLGHGQSHRSHDPVDYTIDAVVSHAIAVLDAEGVEQAPFVGFSRGGLIVAHVMERAPDRVEAAIIGAAPLGKPGRALMDQLVPGLAPLKAGDWSAYWNTFPVPLPRELQEQFAEVNDPKALGAVLEAMIEWPQEVPETGTKSTSVPRLVYFGSGEVFASELRSVLDASGVHYVERDWSGHAETHADAVGVSRIISDFLDGHVKA